MRIAARAHVWSSLEEALARDSHGSLENPPWVTAQRCGHIFNSVDVEIQKKWRNDRREDEGTSQKHKNSFPNRSSVGLSVRPSVVTLKPAICGQFKTGHRDWPKT